MPPVPIEVVVIRSPMRAASPRARRQVLRDQPIDIEPRPRAGLLLEDQSGNSAQSADGFADAAEPARPSDADFVPNYGESHQQASIALMQAISCDVRQAVLLALAQDGPAFVGQLVDRVNSLCPWSQRVDQKLLSHHLTHLRRAGLVHERRRGRQHVYTIEAAHVLYQQHPAGGFSLKIRARGLPVTVTVEVGNDPAKA